MYKECCLQLIFEPINSVNSNLHAFTNCIPCCKSLILRQAGLWEEVTFEVSKTAVGHRESKRCKQEMEVVERHCACRYVLAA